ncbi:peptidoglycan DD-metalloendopeptidase family protein [Candidatus Daviesbacteria bacterium]|nr:peptidoglycan DD-metalloendopeptidase family protein [Candidatus Daviesbacteria bacterium]
MLPKILIGIVLLIIGVISFGFLTKDNNSSPPPFTNNFTQNPRESGDEPPLKIKHIGVNFEDFVFSKDYLEAFETPFMGFGYVIPAEKSSTGQNKANPQPTFILPLGTKVYAIVDGTVANIPTLWSNDLSIQITESGKMEKWVYEVEHVINPKVTVGDKVRAGQEIAEVSNYDKNLKGFGIVEIGILKGGNLPSHVCPFAYLDPQVKEETVAKIKSLYKGWEEYIKSTSFYNEAEEVTGCVSLNPIDG